MKKIKNIFFSVFLIFIVSMYWERCFVVNYANKVNLENASANTGSQSSISSESSSEQEDVPVDLPKNVVQIINSFSESFSSPVIVFPPSLYYSIWQPPKVS